VTGAVAGSGGLGGDVLLRPGTPRAWVNLRGLNPNGKGGQERTCFKKKRRSAIFQGGEKRKLGWVQY